MEENVIIRLPPQAAHLADEVRTSVTMRDHEIWAKDGVQTALLDAIHFRPKTVDEMKRVACAARDGPHGEALDALVLVDFILTFGNAIIDRWENTI